MVSRAVYNAAFIEERGAITRPFQAPIAIKAESRILAKKVLVDTFWVSTAGHHV